MSFLNIKWSPVEYADAAVIAQEAREGTLGRLDFMKLEPKTILDLGAGTGEWLQMLEKRYEGAHLIALDLAETMLFYSKAKIDRPFYICADGVSLPIKTNSIDLITANFLLPWIANMPALLKECKRVLKPDGILMLSALGPDTLQTWRDLLGDVCFPRLMDMHDIGDALVQQGFADPVLDVDYYTTVYRDREKAIAELIASGMLFVEAEQIKKINVPAQEDNKWYLTYEVIFAHAFAPIPTDEFESNASGEVSVPLSHLRRKLTQK